jgi:hypothetical protein
VSAQNVFDRAADSYVKNRVAPRTITEFALQPPQELVEVLVRNETCRVETLLLAGEQLRSGMQWISKEVRVTFVRPGSRRERAPLPVRRKVTGLGRRSDYVA